MSNTVEPSQKRRPVWAVIAHDGKKADLVGFVIRRKEELSKCDLIGTGNTADLVERETGMTVTYMLSGPHGGDAQIAALVATGDCNAVVFLRDPLGMHPHDPDIAMLMRVCDVHNVPLPTNLATADVMIQALSLQMAAN